MKKLPVLLLIGLYLPLAFGGEQPVADLILVDGKVFTVDAAKPNAEAVAIREERILAVGTSQEIAALADADTQRIDLRGHLVIPGINDAHQHFLHTPPGGHELSFRSMEPSWQKTQEALKEAVKKVPAGEWIFGTVGLTVVTEPEATRFALDRIAPDHPVYLSAFYGHGDLINTQAMHALGIAEEEPDPMGGYFERIEGSEQINGKVFEYAQWSLRRRLADFVSDAILVESLQALAKKAVGFGITSIQDMPFLPPDRYVRLLQEAQLPLRVHLIRIPMTTVKGRDLEEGRDLPLYPFGSSLFKVSGTKWVLDGTPLERGASLRGTYFDRPDWSGRLNFPEEEIVSMVRESLKWDDQLLVHCVGDRSVAAVFDAMEGISGVDWAKKRVRIEHGDGLVADLIPRAHRLGVVVVQNPTHLALLSPSSSQNIMKERFEPDTPFFPYRSLVDAGIPLALGSDAPMNPYRDIMLAVMHPLNPSEALTREQAVEAYTRVSAFAEFEEQEKGTITAGKLADITVLSQDIFTVPPEALPETRSILTIVGGRIVHDAERLK